MRIPSEIRRSWSHYGATTGRFLDHLEASGAGWAGEARRAVEAASPFPTYDLHPWPVVLGEAAHRDLAATATGLDALLRALPGHFFAADPEAFCRFYGVASPAVAEVVMSEPTGIGEAVARLDMVATEGGLRCLEYNAGSLVGGWETGILPSHYAGHQPLAGFLEKTGLRVAGPGGLERLFAHLARATLDGGTWDGGGELNTALLIHPHKPSEIALHSAQRYQRVYSRVLERLRPGLGGRVLLCGYADLDLSAPRPTHGTTPVHAAFEQYDGLPDRTAYRLFKAGRWQLFTGPATLFLSDKRNLALLSERADAGGPGLGPAERDLVRRAVPWTRIVRPGETRRGGEAVELGPHLLAEAAGLVLKKGVSLGGQDVVVGRFTPPGRWRSKVQEALAAPGTWIVQEYCPSVPHPGPPDKPGGEVARLDAVWGPFVFGGRFGGSFLRLQGRGDGAGGDGVINSSRGARVGTVVPLQAAASNG